MTPLPREQFPITATGVRWFNHAGTSPLPRDAADAVAGWAAAATNGQLIPDPSPDEVRALAARVLGVAANDITFVRNTTDGIGLVAGGIPWTERDRVVVADCEFPSNLFPWLLLRERGVTVDVVPLDRLRDAIESGAAPTVVAVSWIQYARGERVDLATLAEATHRRDGLLVADVIQGAGVVPCALEEWAVDVAVSGAHKWLLGPSGTGVAYMSPKARERVHPIAPGWASVTSHDDYDDYTLELLPDARRYAGGTEAEGLVAGMGASLRLLLDAGIEAVWTHVDTLCAQLVEQLPASATVLSDRSTEGRSGIVTVAFDGMQARNVARQLANVGIVVKPRGGGVRFAPHAYMDADDIDCAVRALRSFS